MPVQFFSDSDVSHTYSEIYRKIVVIIIFTQIFVSYHIQGMSHQQYVAYISHEYILCHGVSQENSSSGCSQMTFFISDHHHQEPGQSIGMSHHRSGNLNFLFFSI